MVSITLLLAATRAHAADKLWDNPDGGIFTLASNWIGGVPGLNDLARFKITNSTSFPRTYTVAFANDPITQQLVVEDENVTFNLIGSPSNHTYELKNEFVAMALGTVAGRSGNLTVRRGTLKLPPASDLEIAPVAGASGVLTVDVGGAVLGAPNVLVGLNGNGTLNINSGGDVTANEVRVGVNDGSMGTLNVSNGGHIESGLSFIGSIAVGANSGQVTVASMDSGASSVWDISEDLRLGFRSPGSTSGNGTLLIQAGGIVAVTGSTIVGDRGIFQLEGGMFSASGITVAGQFSWTAGTLQVGDFFGNLVVPNGGVLVVPLSTGTEVNGSYNQQAAGAVLALEISGPSNFWQIGR
jgi:hypothetical protein